MMHVMQPLVLDSVWPTTHSSPTDSPAAPLTADFTPVSRATVSASLRSSPVNGANVMDCQPQNISRASFGTLKQADVRCVQPVTERSADVSISSDLTNQLVTSASANPPKPPKKPLTPYMRFSQAMWAEMKQANPNHSVCELGAVIGRMWRELGDSDKQPYYESFTNAKAEYDKQLKSYLDANGLKPSDLVKPKVRKKETKKQQSQVAGEIQQLVAQNQHRQPPWSVSAAATVPSGDQYHTSRPADGQSDDLLVYHVRADGTRECYVQRGVGGMKAAAAAAGGGGGGSDAGGQMTEREMLLSTLAEQTRNVTQLQLQLLNARGRVVELQQQNELLRQLVRDAQPLPPPPPTR